MSWLRIRAVARRHAYVLQRSPQRWFDVVVWPVVDALLFGAIGVYFARQSGAGAKGAGFLLAGILLFHVVFQAEISLATGFMEETWSRNLLNLLVTPFRLQPGTPRRLGRRHNPDVRARGCPGTEQRGYRLSEVDAFDVRCGSDVWEAKHAE